MLFWTFFLWLFTVFVIFVCVFTLLTLFMLIFLYHLLTAYIIPGMMLTFSLCLFFLDVPKKKELKNYVFARKVMASTFLVYSIALICEAVCRNPLAGDLLNSMIVIAIAVTQAFLFTFALITLLNTSFLTRRKAIHETTIVAVSIAAAFLLYVYCPENRQKLVFYCFCLWYALLVMRYITIFRHYYKNYRLRMDNWFSDDERMRLRWVSVAFYSATAVGIVAFLFAWTITPLTQLLFMTTCGIYYSVFAVKFMNYVHVFLKIETPLIEESEEMPQQIKEWETETEDDRILIEQIEHIIKAYALFKKPDLSIANVAALCGKNHRIVSEAINHCQGVNFKTYINEFRLAEAVRLIEAGWLKCHTLEALAKETGFTNRISLYRSFKRKNGMSPSDYMANKSC